MRKESFVYPPGFPGMPGSPSSPLVPFSPAGPIGPLGPRMGNLTGSARPEVASPLHEISNSHRPSSRWLLWLRSFGGFSRPSRFFFPVAKQMNRKRMMLMRRSMVTEYTHFLDDPAKRKQGYFGTRLLWYNVYIHLFSNEIPEMHQQQLDGTALMAVWSKALSLTVSCQ